MTNRPEFHLVDTAAFHLGAVPFSAYNTFAVGQVDQVLANAGCQVVVCEQHFAPLLPEVTGGTAIEPVVCVDGRIETAGIDPSPSRRGRMSRIPRTGRWHVRLGNNGVQPRVGRPRSEGRPLAVGGRDRKDETWLIDLWALGCGWRSWQRHRAR